MPIKSVDGDLSQNFMEPPDYAHEPPPMSALQDLLFAQFQSKDLLKKAERAGQAYLDGVFDRNAAPSQAAIQSLEAFDEALPIQTTNGEDILDQLINLGSPATSAQIGGRYFGFVNGSVLPVALAARQLAGYWDQNAALNVMSPISAKLEAVAESWLCALFGLAEGSVAGFVSGSSIANLSGIAAARWRLFHRLGWDINRQGLAGAPRLRILISAQAHGTVLKMIGLLGFGTDNVEILPVDAQGRLCAAALPPLDERTILILQAGNVTSGAFDDFENIMPLARAAKSWVHVDGAFGLWAALAPSTCHHVKNMESADSFATDGHKTLNLPYDNAVIMSSDSEALRAAFHSMGAYIQKSGGRDGMFLTPEMSRRARGVEFWAGLKFLGREGIAALVELLHERAKEAAKGFRAAGFEVLNDVVFNQVIVADGKNTTKLMEAIQSEGEIWLGPGQWFGRDVIRFSVCSWASRSRDIERAITAFTRARHKIMNDNSRGE